MSFSPSGINSLSGEPCTLCGLPTPRALLSRDRRRHFECASCGLVFAARAERLPRSECERRYLQHENGIENAGYCDFLNRAVNRAAPFLPPGSKGLDYGCGPGPTLSKLLAALGHSMTDYDPIFFDRPLEPPYDFVFSTECFEHFEEPALEIAKIVALLRPGGVLAIMTDLWNASTDFGKWHYATDPTHVSFYSAETLSYVERTFGLERLASDEQRVFVFAKK